ncbi:MAG: V-type ATP synthase subunit E [Bacillota bacterium]
MAGVEKIKEKIIKDSEDKAAEIIANAKAQAEDILKKAQSEAAHKADELVKKAEHEINEKKRIVNSMAELEIRNELLKTKQELIEKVFVSALDKLSSMDINEYKSLMKQMMVKAVETGEEEVILSEKDRKTLSESFVSEVNAMLSANGKLGALKLSNDTANIRGGFLLRSKGMEINNSFEALIKMHRDEIEPKVAELLF